MSLILSLIASLLPTVVAALQKVTGLSTGAVALIDGLGVAGASLGATLTASPQTGASILAAFAATITVLQQELAGNAGATVALIYLGAFEAAVAAGIAASKITVVDPTQIVPVVPA